MKKKSFALVFGLMVIVVLASLSATMLSRSISENKLAKQSQENIQAFWLAEAGINRALMEMRAGDTTIGSNRFLTSLGDGQYAVDMESFGTGLKVTGKGAIPSFADPSIERSVETIISSSVPSGFYDHAIYSADEITFNGSAFTVTGDVLYATTITEGKEAQIDGAITQDPTVSPLARFNFEQLLALSEDQGNVYDVSGKKLLDSETGLEEALPSQFWYRSDGVHVDGDTDQDGVIDAGEEWMPNIVYIRGALDISGNKTIGGFLVVVGDIISDPDSVTNADIGGNSNVNGVIYATGDFRFHGGGGKSCNVDGGIWAGTGATISGSVIVTYDEDYMHAIQDLDLNTDYQITNWREDDPIYPLSN